MCRLFFTMWRSTCRLRKNRRTAPDLDHENTTDQAYTAGEADICLSLLFSHPRRA
jgi:hypothetical protein